LRWAGARSVEAPKPALHRPLQSEPHSIKLTFAVAAEVLEIHNLIFIIFLFFLSAEQQQQQQQDPDRRSSLEQE